MTQKELAHHIFDMAHPHSRIECMGDAVVKLKIEKELYELAISERLKQQEIDATEVIIRTPDKEIVITDPQVSKVNMMGQQTYQIVGTEQVRELSTEPEINDDDVKTVVEQTGASEDKVRATLEATKGDLAEAILKLK